MKKKMFYNMKVKTLQRCFSSVIKLLKRARKVRLDSIYQEIMNAEKRSVQIMNGTDPVKNFGWIVLSQNCVEKGR